jgi:hypothetical protein
MVENMCSPFLLFLQLRHEADCGLGSCLGLFHQVFLCYPMFENAVTTLEAESEALNQLSTDDLAGKVYNTYPLFLM